MQSRRYEACLVRPVAKRHRSAASVRCWKSVLMWNTLEHTKLMWNTLEHTKRLVAHVHLLPFWLYSCHSHARCSRGSCHLLPSDIFLSLLQNLADLHHEITPARSSRCNIGNSLSSSDHREGPSSALHWKAHPREARLFAILFPVMPSTDAEPCLRVRRSWTHGLANTHGHCVHGKQQILGHCTLHSFVLKGS